MNPLSLEQVRFLAATVAPHFRPLIDRPLSHPMTPVEMLSAASWAVATYEPLHTALVAEIFPDTTAATDRTLIAWRTVSIIAATIEAHDHGELVDTIAEELMKHSAALRGELPHG
jgi:hypothetical protein